MSQPTILILTVISLSQVLGNRHYDGCFNSASQLENRWEDPAVGSECFEMQAHFTSDRSANRIQLAVLWHRESELCRSIKVRLVEIMVRGGPKQNDYRYPIGTFKYAKTAFCREINNAGYFKLFDAYIDSSDLTIMRHKCDPQSITTLGLANFYAVNKPLGKIRKYRIDRKRPKQKLNVSSLSCSDFLTG